MDELTRQKINRCIAEISDGDYSALEILSSLVSARMLSVAQSVLHQRSLAEDAVQDAFVKIVDNAKRFDKQTNGYAWICKITQNCALNILRRERRHRAENIDDCFFLADPSDPFGLSENTVTLQNALSVLDDTEKKVVYQKYFMDFTVRDIAASLGMSKSTVQRTLDRAENKLRAYLSDE